MLIVCLFIYYINIIYLLFIDYLFIILFIIIFIFINIIHSLLSFGCCLVSIMPSYLEKKFFYIIIE